MTAPPLSYEQTAQVLKKFANLEHTIVLVGGQAVNFWANHYERRAPQLAEHAPHTSKDIDFMGSRDAVRECAKRLGGTAKLATLDDMNTPSTGAVVFVDENNHRRQIDFLGSAAGLDDTAIVDTAIRATIDDEQSSDRRAIDFAYERQRHAEFLGRADLLARLDRHLIEDTAQRWVVVTGGPGMGKSAVLAAWLARREAAGEIIPHHFIRRGEYDRDDLARLAGPRRSGDLDAPARTRGDSRCLRSNSSAYRT